jgi:hypothetical protein
MVETRSRKSLIKGKTIITRIPKVKEKSHFEKV